MGNHKEALEADGGPIGFTDPQPLATKGKKGEKKDKRKRGKK